MKYGNYKWVNWKEKDIQKAGDDFLKMIKKNILEIKKIKLKDRDFKNTISALEFISGDEHNVVNFLEVLMLLSPKKEIREKAMDISAKIQNEVTLLLRDRDLYAAVLEYKNNKKNLKEDLSSSEELIFSDTVKSFERMGFNLKENKEKKYKSNLKKLSKKELKFSSNISEYKDFIEIEKKDLEDLPKNFTTSLKKNKKGKYEISIEHTQMIPFIENSRNIEKRKELIIKSSKRGGQKNLDLLQDILQLRKENAKLLGFKNHGEYVLEDRMAKKVSVVEKFESSLIKKIKKNALKEIEELEEFKNNLEKTKNRKIKFYDFAFYAKKMELKKFSFDEEKVREYFELNSVRNGMFSLFGNLFGISFQKKEQKLWEKSVELFEIFDKKSKEKISEIAFDLSPREGKHSGAFMTHSYSGFYSFKEEKYEQNSILISCNFRKPTKKIPSLLSIDDMITLFHEFGHSLHGALSKGKYPSQFGTSVKWDFVEVPSQLLENWIKNEKVLKKLSSHYKTGKKIPKNILGSIIKSEKFLKSNRNIRQLSLGVLDMSLHTKGHKNPEKLYKKIIKENTGRDSNEESLFPASFGHLMGYDAGYYSYMWALVIADDIYSEFEKNGIFKKKTGMKYRREILEVGSERDELKSVEKFLGRKTNNKYFLKKLK